MFAIPREILDYVCYCFLAVLFIQKLQEKDLIPRSFWYKPYIFLSGYLVFEPLIRLPFFLFDLYQQGLLMSFDVVHLIYHLFPPTMIMLMPMIYHQITKWLGISEADFEEFENLLNRIVVALQNLQRQQEQAAPGA